MPETSDHEAHDYAERLRGIKVSVPLYEHIFGYMSQSMKGFYLRALGRRRNAAAMGLINRIYHLARDEQIVRLRLLPLRTG